MSNSRVLGILFDKDGTLFDFHTTWSRWAQNLIYDYSQGDPVREARLAESMGFDLARRQFSPQSMIIAGTNRQAAECVARAVPERDINDIERDLIYRAASANSRSPVDLPHYLSALSEQGIALGVMTNDSEYAARGQLRKAGVEDHFDFIAGFDSGYGAKPDPSPLLAFAQAMSLQPADVIMVGDSLHDMMAGRAAGMRTVGVLTGLATANDLRPYADMVFPDIGHLPGWIGL